MNSVVSWELKRLSELAQYINGMAFKPEDWGKDGLPIIRIEQLKNPDSISDHYAGKLPEANIINNGDLIFSWSASLFLRIWQHGKAALNQHLFKVVEKDNVDRLFLKFFIEYYLPELTKASHGSTMQHITRKELDSFAALFPTDKQEQTQIAKILSTLDQAIEQTEAIIAKQQRIKTGLMQDLLTRGIDENGNIRSEDTHEFKDSSLGRIPVEWEVLPLSEVADLQVGYAFKSSWFSESGIPLLRGDNVGNGSPEWKDIKYLSIEMSALFKDYLLDENDLIIGMDRTFTKKGAKITELKEQDTPSLLVQRVGRFIPNKITHGYMKVLLHSELYQTALAAHEKGMDIPHLSKSEILSPLIPVPDTELERKKISKKLYGFSSLIYENINNLYKLKKVKNGLMQDLLTGKVRVTDLLTETDANNETVSH